MNDERARAWWTDAHTDNLVGNVLRGGVIVAALLALFGGFVLVAAHGGQPVDYRVFDGGPEGLRHIASIARGAAHFDANAIVQLALVVLIATPIARVALSLFAFAMQRDRLYVTVSEIVLALLLYALFFSR